MGIFALAACSEDVYHDIDTSGASQEVILNPTSIPGGLYISYDEFFHNGTRIYLEVKTDATQMSVTLAPVI